MFKLGLSPVIALAAFFWMPTLGYAGIIRSNGFDGYYSLTPSDGNPYGNWTIEVTEGSSDFVDFELSQNRARFVVSEAEITVRMSILIPATGQLTFSWDFSPEILSVDEQPIFGYQLEDELLVELGPTGSQSVDVEEEQVLTFVFNSNWFLDESVFLEISEFSAPYNEVIPEPNTLVLLALAFAGLGVRQLWRRRKRGVVPDVESPS